jgi:hypothetical protein
MMSTTHGNDEVGAVAWSRCASLTRPDAMKDVQRGRCSGGGGSARNRAGDMNRWCFGRQRRQEDGHVRRRPFGVGALSRLSLAARLGGVSWLRRGSGIVRLRVGRLLATAARACGSRLGPLRRRSPAATIHRPDEAAPAGRQRQQQAAQQDQGVGEAASHASIIHRPRSAVKATAALSL